MRAMHDCAIIERIEEDEVLASGIILLNSQTQRDPIAKGKVLSIGTCYAPGGSVIDPGIKAGDVVIYRRNAYSIDIPHDVKKYFSVPVGRIECVLESQD